MSRCVHPVVYVSGPVTGMRDGNRPAFEEAALRCAPRAALPGYRTTTWTRAPRGRRP